MLIDTNFWRRDGLCEISDEIALQILRDIFSKMKPEDIEENLDLTLRECVRREIRKIWNQYNTPDFQHLINSHYQEEKAKAAGSCNTETETHEEHR